MSDKFLYRAVDDMGRIIIPKEIRQQMEINEGDYFDVIPNKDGTILLKPHK